MPELPEVETVKRGLEPILLGQVIASVQLRRADLRFPFPEGFAETLAGAKILSLTRRAKYILVDLDNNHTLIAHLGMTGRFTVLKPEGGGIHLGEFYFETGAKPIAGGLHDHVVFTLGNGVRLVYSDPRRFGMMDLIHTLQLAQHKLLKDIGIEPLGNKLTVEYLVKKFKGKSTPLKAALLDQPGRTRLHPAVGFGPGRRTVGHLVSSEHRISEERARAATVGVAAVDHHAL